MAGLHVAVQFGGPALTPTVRDKATSLTVILVSLIVIWRALRVKEQRLAWRVIAAAILSYSTGTLLWFNWLEHLSNPPIPSPSDALWLLFYPVSMVGILLLLRAEQPKASGVVRLQAAMIGAGVGAIGVVLVFIPILLNASGSAPAVSTELAYPLGDLFLAGLVMAGWRLRGWRLDLRWGLLGAGFLLLAVADSLYGLAVVRGFPITGELVDVLYLVAFGLIALAAWAPSHAAPVDPASVCERARIEAELAELHERAYRDRLTGLPNGLALEEELRAHEDTRPFSVLVLDFDGMREANNVFKSYRRGGDVLIAAVGRALGGLLTDGEFAARQYTAGDEFAILIPGADAEAAARRAGEVEDLLDMLDVPPAYKQIYRGASVGHATRRPGETPGQALGRAVAVMQERKSERRAAREQPMRSL
ncbi:MAG: GGDEF domain-containing protein [Solirubrobacteraceae bacterium]